MQFDSGNFSSFSSFFFFWSSMAAFKVAAKLDILGCLGWVDSPLLMVELRLRSIMEISPSDMTD